APDRHAQKAREVDEDAARKTGGSKLEAEFFDEKRRCPGQEYRRDEICAEEDAHQQQCSRGAKDETSRLSDRQRQCASHHFAAWNVRLTSLGFAQQIVKDQHEDDSARAKEIKASAPSMLFGEPCASPASGDGSGVDAGLMERK